jgi:hypothetical protein
MRIACIAGAVLLCVSFHSAEAGWERTNGPSGGRIRAIATCDGVLYAGTWGMGVFRSTDNGATWTQTDLGLPGATIHALTSIGTKLFAGCEGAGVALSTNGGASWSQLSNGLPTFYSIDAFTAIAGPGSTYLYAGTSNGLVFASTDEGASWDTVFHASTAITALGALGGSVFVGGYFGVFRSSDFGSNWVEADSGMAYKYPSEIATDGLNLYVSTFGGGVSRSTNGGVSWSQSGLTGQNLWHIEFCDSTLFAGDWGSGVYRSTNGGNSWVQALPSKYVVSLGVSGKTIFAAGQGEGIYRSTNRGVDWTSVGLSYEMTSAIGGYGTTVIAGGYGGVSTSTDSGATWVRKGLADRPLTCFAFNGANIFAGASVGGVFLSTDNGTTWNAVNTGLTNTSVYALAFASNGAGGKSLFAGTRNGGVYVSADTGKNWTQINTGLTNKDVFSFSVNGDILYAGTYGGGVFLSTNGGSAWSPTGLTNAYVLKMLGKGTGLFAGTRDNGVYYSADSGKSWNQIGFPGTSIRTMAGTDNKVFVGNGSGVWLTTNNGTRWSAVNSGLADSNVHSLGAVGTNLYAGVGSGGVWKSTLQSLVVSVPEGSVGAPRMFSLEQNYPNPFNPKTVVSCLLPVASWTRLVVYDVLGREVTVLMDEEKQPGTYLVTFDASHLSSGVYFYRLTAGDFSVTRRMLLVR